MNLGRTLRERERTILTGTRRSGAEVLATLATDVHPIGFRMAREIRSVLGRRRLVRCVGRPAEFRAAYREAADRTGGPGLSQELERQVRDAR